MLDLTSRLVALKRPRLLVRTARIGARDYTGPKHLKRLLGANHPKRRAIILMRLLDIESEQEAGRATMSPGYSFRHHLDVLIAIAAESQIYLQDAKRRPSGAAPILDEQSCSVT